MSKNVARKLSLVWIVLFSCSYVFALAPDIVNGRKVRKKDPIAFSTIYLNINNRKACTATILSKNIAITAAHCVTDNSRRALDHKTLTLHPEREVSYQGPSMQVRGMIIPNNFILNQNLQEGSWDYAVLYFDDYLSDNYHPAKILPSSYQISSKETVVVAGYGTTISQTAAGVGVLRKKDIKFQRQFKPHEVIFDQSRGGMCFGDSGGPSFIEIKREPYFFGVASRVASNGGDACSWLSIYTDVRALKGEINAAIEALHNYFKTPVSVRL